MDKSNSTNESQHESDDHSRTGEPPHEAPAPIAVDSSDPVIDKLVDHQSDRKLHPDATISVETTQVSESDLLAATGVRTVFADKKHGNSQDRPQDQNGRDKNRGGLKAPQHDADRGRDQQRSGDDRSRQHQPSMMKHLLITAGVALVCGVIGAMGYAYLFGPNSKGSSPEGSQGKSDSSSKKESGSKEKSGGGESTESGKGSNAQALTTNSIPGFSSVKDADMLKQQIKDLSRRVDHLRERVNGVTQPTDATPLALRTMQIKMSELTHAVADVAAVPAAYRQYDYRLKTLNEELKILRERIDAAQTDSIGGRISILTPPARIAAPTPSVYGSTASNPTDQGSSGPER
jgi:hypothetical protein